MYTVAYPNTQYTQYIQIILSKYFYPNNRKFWKTVKPILSNKFVKSEKITLTDNEKVITNDKEIAKFLNDFFSNII